MSTLGALRVDYRSQPLNVDASAPVRFSWTISSDAHDVTQRQYRLTVADADVPTDVCWDSGPVATGQMSGIEYAGPALRPGRRYRWTVEVELDGDAAPPAQSADFATAPDAEAWAAAQWICQPRPPTLPVTERRVAYFVRQLPAATTRATVHATAGGVYRLWVNGCAVGPGLLAPGWTDYEFRVPFHTYDITDLLTDSPAVLGVELADGWYSGFLGPFDKRNFWGEQPVFRAMVVCETGADTESETVVVSTDSSWRTGTGAIRGTDLLHGEQVDLRAEVPGWNHSPDTTVNWPSAVETVGPQGLLVPSRLEPVRPVRTVEAVDVRELLPGSVLVDLGQNCAGFLQLRVPATDPGRIVRVRHAEVLNDDGSLYIDNLRSATVTDTYVLDGTAREVAPTFTYHGFRYAEVTGLPGVPQPADFTGVAVSSVADLIGDFECDNPLLTAYHHAICWGVLSNFIETPHDCPNRDERLGWGGDAHVFTPTALMVGDVADLLDKWTDDLLDAQGEDGCFADIAPGKVLDFGPFGSPGYADAAVFVPWHVYRHRGDLGILRRAFEPATRWLAHIAAHNPDHVWKNKRHNDYGDWLGLEDTDKELVGTAYWARAARVVQHMALALDKVAEAAELADLHGRIAEAFQARYLDQNGSLRQPTQAACVLAIDNNLLSDAQRERVAAQLIANIEQRQHPTTGFLAVADLLPTLSAIGRADLAHLLLLREQAPSWGFQIRNGMTTFTERWNPWDGDGAPTEPSMNSFNHFCLGSLGQWLYSTVGGIAADAPGYTSVRIAPRPMPDVRTARYRLQAPSGDIECRWNTAESAGTNTFTAAITVPANVSATVDLPGTLVSADPPTAAPADQTGPFVIGSGSYTFATRL